MCIRDRRWIDTNKGDEEKKEYRSRLVAKEFKDSDRPELFAGTPPLEGLKLIAGEMARSNGKKCVMTNDVSRAFFHAKTTRPVYVELPEEDKTEEYRRRDMVG